MAGWTSPDRENIIWDGTINATKNLVADSIFANLTLGSVLFAGSNGKITQDNSNLFWDDLNKRVGIGTDSPSESLEVNGNIYVGVSAAATGADLLISPDGTAQTNIRTMRPDHLSFGTNTNKDQLMLRYEGQVGIRTPTPVTTLHVEGDTTLSGAVLFGNSTTGLAHGEVYMKNNTSETTITTQNVPVCASGAWVEGKIFNCTTAQNADGSSSITATNAGRYLVTVSTTMESITGASSVSVLDVSGAIVYPNLHMHRSLAGGGGDVGSTSMNGIVELAAGEKVFVEVTNTTNTQNYIVEDCTLSIVQIGGA